MGVTPLALVRLEVFAGRRRFTAARLAGVGYFYFQVISIALEFT